LFLQVKEQNRLSERPKNSFLHCSHLRFFMVFYGFL
jgi:hypothetical protein